MIDWTQSMRQTFEFYRVDPNTWKDVERIMNIQSSSIDRDITSATRGSATFDSTDTMDECYIRIYLIVNQNEETSKIPLATVLAQTPSTNFNGMFSSTSIDAYTPLIEIKDRRPPIGYTVYKDANIMNVASDLTAENTRAPVVAAKSDVKLYSDFTANVSDDWLTYLTQLMSNAKFEYDVDPMGRILFSPRQDIGALQPVWVYDDGNCSILQPSISNSRDLYGIPNVVEVIYSTSSGFLYSKVVNDDPNSPISTVSRGREVMYRDTSPRFQAEPTQEEIDKYAVQLLRNLSSLEHTIKYTHGYCPVRVGDAVMLDIKSAGLVNIKAKVIQQSIKCDTGCQVSETAVYTTKLWR